MRSEEIERVRQKTEEKKLVFFSSSAGVESRESIRMVARYCVCFSTQKGKTYYKTYDTTTRNWVFHLFFIETLTPHRHITSVFLPLSLLLKILFSSSCSRRRHKKNSTPVQHSAAASEQRWQSSGTQSVDTKNKLIQFLCVLSRISNSDMSCANEEHTTTTPKHPNKVSCAYVRYTLLFSDSSRLLSAAEKHSTHTKPAAKKAAEGKSERKTGEIK